MALLDRLLSFKFQLASGGFSGGGGGNVVEVSGRRATARVIKAGTPSLGTAEIQIWGLPLPLINRLATLGMVYQLIPRNVVTVSAGDEESGMAVVFSGTVTQAWGAFQGAPDVPLIVLAHTLGAESVISQEPMSFTGSTDAAGAMKTLAGKMGCSFENNGVDAKLPSPYLYGSARSMADQCAEAGGFNWFADDDVLAIWPKGGARGGDVPLIAPPPRGEMAGYPEFTAYGIALKTVFDRRLKFGGKVRIESSLEAARGEWAVMKLQHSLSSKLPGGDWFSRIDCFNPKYPQPVLG